MRGSRRARSALAANRYLQAAQLGSAKRRDHVLDAIAGDLDQREGVVDLDRPDRARLEPRLSGDRADEIAGTNATAPSGADEDPHHVAVADATLVTGHAAARGLQRTLAPDVRRRRGGGRHRNFLVVAVAARRRV